MWKNSDKDFLIENHGAMTSAEIADSIGKSVDAVNYMASRLGLSAPRSSWSDENIAYLMANMDNQSYNDIADYLGKSIRAVANKASNIRMSGLIEVNLLDIEDGVKMRPSTSAVYRAMLSKLDVGQSFTFPRKERATLNNQRALFADKIFRAQTIDEQTMRLWRIK